MKARTGLFMGALFSAGVFLGALVLGNTPVTAEHHDSAHAGGASQADEAAMKAKWEKNAAPNEHHKALEPLIGTWNYNLRWWMDPSQAPSESKGSNTNAWIMGGRFVQQNTTGEAMGQPFEGMGITGYDNVKGEYTSLWLDNMSTGIMTASGQYDAATKTLTEQCTFSCPMTEEKAMQGKGVLKLLDANHYTYEMYGKGPDGKEFRSMEIVYERAQ